MTKIDLTAMTLTEIESLGAVALRKFAAELGVKGASRGKKSDLLDAIVPMWEAAKAEAAKTAKPAKKAKTEKPAKVRKIRFSQDELAMEENGHSDNSHEELSDPNADLDIKNGGWTFRSQADADAWFAETRKIMETCPICHPEIIANTAHSGSSRAGMVINVPVRANGATKAATVAARLDAVKIPAKIRRFKGHEILTAEIDGTELRLEWDAQGRYVYGSSKFGTRKVRNVSEALRLAVTA